SLHDALPILPGDLLRGVLQEVACREARPCARDVALGDAALEQQAARGILRLAHEMLGVDRALESPAERALHALVEIAEQRCLPGVPQLRIRGALVRTGQNVQIVEVRPVAYLERERVDDLRIADVLLLGG